MTEISCFMCKKIIDDENILCPKCGQDPINKNILEGIQDMFNLTIKLNKKIQALHQKYVIDPSLSFEDERNQSLGALNNTAFWLNIQLMLYSLQKRTDPVPQKILLTNPSMNDEELLRALINLDNTNLRAFLTLFLSHIEVLLARIVTILPDPDYGYGYKNLINHILKQLTLTTPENELYWMLNVPAIIRNTLHTNGLYTGTTVSGKISEISFKFEHNKHVFTCWRQIYFLCDKILDALEIILKHPLIKNKTIQTPNIDPLS